jgi:hypothetical protein
VEKSVRSLEVLEEPRGIATLWFAMLAGPVAWFTGLNLNYSLVRLACAKGSLVSLHLVSALTLALAVSGGVVAWREWRRVGGGWPGEGGDPRARSRFMAVIGLMSSALFSVVILAQWVAQLILNPCVGI